MQSLRKLIRVSNGHQTLCRSLCMSPKQSQQSKKLDGRVAVTIGCTEGTGLAMARRLAEDGAHIVLGSRKQENVDKAIDLLKSEGLNKVSGIACHVGDDEQRDEMLRKTAKAHGGFDILLNNAGVNPHVGPILETSNSAYDKAFHVNTRSNFFLVRDAVQYMKGRKHQGAIVLTSSISGYRLSSYPGAYAVSKLAVIGMVQSFAPELHSLNIRINCITLGLFNTAFADCINECEESQKYYKSFIMMKRGAHPSECSSAASFLCSDDSSYMTGENMVVAGGVYARV